MIHRRSLLEYVAHIPLANIEEEKANVKYFQDMMFAACNVPKEYLSYEEQIDWSIPAQKIADAIDKGILDELLRDFDEETDRIAKAHDDHMWPHKNGCPLCGADAYVGFASVKCSNGGCKNVG